MFVSLSATAQDPSLDQIKAFWQSTRARLDQVPMNPEVTPSGESLPYHKVKVILTGLEGKKFFAYLATPVQGESKPKPWPVIITTCGYSGNQQGIMDSECQRGYAVIQLYPRGQGPSAQLSPFEGDKVVGSTNGPEGAYYQGCYADVMRMIDFVQTRPELDAGRIALVATSQGGGISLAVGALDKRVKAVVAHVPCLCNFRMASGMQSLVRGRLNQASKITEASLTSLGYFDPYLLAPMLDVPVLMSAGGKDVTCPQATIQSVYDKIHSKKKIKLYPDLVHTSCQDFYLQTWKWLDKNFK